MNERGQFELLDLLTIISFALQVQNQSNILGISDVQSEVNRAVDAINAHLAEQDKKLTQLIKKTEGFNGNHQETG